MKDKVLIPDKKTISEWIKEVDPENTIKLAEWAVGNPDISAAPYSNSLSQDEFIHILLYIISICSNKITFEEEKIWEWTEIAKFLDSTVKTAKKLCKKYNAPIAVINSKPFTTKERLGVWLNSLITEYPFFTENYSDRGVRTVDEYNWRINELEILKRRIINYEDFTLDGLLYLDSRIDKLKQRRDSKTIKSESLEE